MLKSPNSSYFPLSHTLSDKISLHFCFKIFYTKLRFRQFCLIFAWLLYWNIGQNFQRTKHFVGQNFRHHAEISTLLSDFCPTFKSNYWTKFSTDKSFRRTKFSTPSRNFDTFVRFLPNFCIETLDKIFDGQNFDNFVRRIFVR